MTDYNLDVVLIEYDQMWSAQCLQYDIGAQGKTLKDVIYELQRSLIGYIAICAAEDVEPFTNLPIAPDKYWQLWKEGARLSIELTDAHFRTPDHLPLPRTQYKLGDRLIAA